MKIIKRAAAIILVLIIIPTLLTGCGSKEDDINQIPVSSAGKDIKKAVGEDNIFSLNTNSKYSFNPIIATNHSNQLVCSLVFENMLEVDNEFNVIPGIIKEWTVSDDGMSWTFSIDDSHMFHDGSPVTSNDVRRSLEAAINADRYAGRFSTIAGVSHSGDTVYVTLISPNKRFVKLMNVPVVKTGTYGDKYPIGSGPYMFNEDHTELNAFEGYPGYEDLPVDTVYLKEYTSAEEIISAFENSLIDVVVNDPTSLTDLGYASSNEFRTMVTTNMHYVAFNETSMLGKYSNFRVAMQYAFDREYLARDLLQGNGVAAPVPMCPSSPYYPAAFAQTLGYNIEKCRTILSNMGVRDYDDDGKLEFMNGSPQKINLSFIVCSDSSAKSGVVNRFAEDMDKIGLKVTVKEMVWSDFLEALENGDFDMYYAEVKLRNDFDITRLVAVRNKDNESVNINYTGSTDVFYLEYLNHYLMASETDAEAKYLDFCKYLSNNAIIIPLGFEKQQIITHRGVIKGIDANIGNPLYNFANWQIDLS